MNDFLEHAATDIADIAAIRQDIHAHPELGFEETRTSALVIERLRSWGVDVTTEVATTGVVGTIRGKRPGTRCIGLRADMDALALNEVNDMAHASRHPGRMHACGHDGHTAMLLGAARRLALNPDFSGTVHLIFQPAEEGRGGALAMIADKLFDRFPCDRIFGMHSYPALPIGTFATTPNAFMAASGRWQVTFEGPGGHGGATPHLVADLTVIQAHFVLGLQTIIARNVSPSETAIISVGHIQAGSPDAMNVMPAVLKISGTMRAFSEGVQKQLESRIAKLAQMQAQLQGATATVKCWWNSAPVVNDVDATASAVAAATRVVGAGAVEPRMRPVTAGEDFSFMLQQRPGCFVFIGNGGGGAAGVHRQGHLHMPTYDFQDEALPYGIAYWLSVVHQELGEAESEVLS